MVYVQESKFDLEVKDDSVSFSQAFGSVDYTKWIDTMIDELKSMEHNEVWDLVKLPEGYKRVECKWVFKTKHDSVANGYTQRDDIDYKETFSPVSKKDSLELLWH